MKSNRIFSTVFVLFVFFSSISTVMAKRLKRITGSDNTVTKVLDLKDFYKISVSNTIKLSVLQAKEYKVDVTVNDNVEKYLDFYTKNNTLILKMKKGYSYRNINVSVLVSMPDLKGLEAGGASDVSIEEFVCGSLNLNLSGASDLDAKLKVTNSLFVDASGASDLDFEAEANDMILELSGASDLDAKLIINQGLKIDASGASDIDIDGKSNSGIVELSGSSDLDGDDFIILNNLDFDGSGSSSANFTVNGKISVELSGASSLKLDGEGSIYKQNISGGSSLRMK